MKKILLLLVSFLLIQGCVSKHMVAIPANEPPVAAKPEDAVVIFMRPSGFGDRYQASVFDSSTHGNHFIGIVSSHTKVAYSTSPGKKLFMVVGENADFMQADLEAGKTYFVLVRPRVGMFKVRYSLSPVSAAQLQTAEFVQWETACDYVKNLPSAEMWARENADSIQSKRQSYYAKWVAKGPSDKPMLFRHDGKNVRF